MVNSIKDLKIPGALNGSKKYSISLSGYEKYSTLQAYSLS
jgi:hypothetical protein